MPMELWILVATGGAGIAFGIIYRLRRPQRRAEAAAKNIYTLW